MTIQRRALNAVKWNAIEQWGRQVLAFIVFALIARILGPDVIGLATMAMLVVLIAERIVGESLVDAIVQRQDLDDGHIDVAFWLQISIALVLMVILGLLARPLAWAFGEAEVEALVYALLPVVLLIALASVPSTLFRRAMNFKILALRTTLSLVIGGLVGIGMALGGFGVWSIVGQQVTARAVEACVVWLGIDWRPGNRGTRRHASDLAHFGMTTLASNILASVDTWATRFILGVFLGPAALGYFHVGQRLLDTVRKLIFVPVNRVSFPLIANMQDDIDRVTRIYLRIVSVASLIATPCFVGAVVVATPMAAVLFGESWRPAGPIIQILMLSGIVLTPLGLTGTLFRSLGRPEWTLQVAFVSIAASVVGLAVAARWGVEAAGLVLLARELFIALPLTIRRLPGLIRVKLGAVMSAITTGLLAAGAMAVTVVAIQALLPATLPDIAVLLILSVSGAVVYVALILLFYRTMLRELRGFLHRARTPQSGETIG